MIKKLFIVFLLFLLLGCKKIDINEDYASNVKNCLNDTKITNNVALGYRYYIPKGVKKVKDYDYNQVFLVDDSKIYLYVDIVSYFYNKELKLENDNNVFYYEVFNFNDKTGYIRIDEVDNKYFVNITYNFSKIEVVSSYEELNKIITMSSIILNSIDYNKDVIEKVMDGDLGQFSEFTYEVEKPEDASSNFSHYLEEYVPNDEEVEWLPDE